MEGIPKYRIPIPNTRTNRQYYSYYCNNAKSNLKVDPQILQISQILPIQQYSEQHPSYLQVHSWMNLHSWTVPFIF